MDEAVTPTLILPASPCSASPKIIAAVVVPPGRMLPGSSGQHLSLGKQKNASVLLQPLP